MASILPSPGPSSSSLAGQRKIAQRPLAASSSNLKPAPSTSKSQSSRLAPTAPSAIIAPAPPSPSNVKPAPLAPVLSASPSASSSSPTSTASISKKDSTGPLVQPSKEWVLPARAKPGRKPSETEPLTKRKAQNRASQRAFRERKQSYLADLEAKVAAYEAAEIDRSVEIQRVAQKLRAENEALRKEVGSWKEKFMQLERFLLQAKANGGKLPGMVVTPSVKSGPGCKAPAHERAAPKKGVLVAPGGKDGKSKEKSSGGVRFADAVQPSTKIQEDAVMESKQSSAPVSVPLRRRPFRSNPTTPIDATPPIEPVADAPVPAVAKPPTARKEPKPPLWSFETPKTSSPPAPPSITTTTASVADNPASLLSPSLLPDGGHLSIGGGCGFCTEASPCVCADDFLDFPSTATSSQPSHIAVPSDVPSALPLPKRTSAPSSSSSTSESSRRMSIGSLTHANDIALSHRKRSSKLWYTVAQPSPPSPPRSLPLSIRSKSTGGKKLWSLTESAPSPDEPVCTGDPSTCGACSTDPGLAAFCEAVTTATSTTPATSPTQPVMMPSGTLPISSTSPYSTASLRGETIPSAWRQIRSHPRFSQWQGGLDLLAEVVSKRSGNVKSPMLPHVAVGEKRGREASVEIEPSRNGAAVATSNDRATFKPVLLHTASEGTIHALPTRAKQEEGEEEEREGKRRRIVIDREAVQEALAFLDAGTAAQPRSSSAKEEQPCPCPWRPGDKRSSPP
ncbi:uncharacterized protein UDID_03611 [Ustilago sp. UG-2017a]|nr:uncharacterized protein UDID_03611 [Ustilago sp. UG-2017a]